MNQTTIFDMMYPKYKINNPLRVITLFSGYDSQCLALNYLGIKYEHWRTCEWAVKSIQALKDIHFPDDNFDYSKSLTKDELINKLYNLGISSNYNEPMSFSQINKLKEKEIRKIYNNIIASKNMVNIQQVKGNDLGIENTNLFTYLLTYSFPCQDLSSAGLGKGMSDTSTRSGMLWEVERILNECKENNKMPEILLMENVPDIHNYQNIADFHKWQVKLEELGYKSYWQDLNATDYGIPQSRNRCFMVSILGNYSYTFPKPIPLKLKLKDILEDNVDEKYFLSDKMIQGMLTTNFRNYKLENKLLDKEGIANTIVARYEGSPQCIGTYQYAKSDKFMQGRDRLQLKKQISDTLQTTQKEGIVNANFEIRKLTPRECFRLMGVKDEDFNKVCKNQNDSSLWHLAGDSIVVNVLMAIFKELF